MGVFLRYPNTLVPNQNKFTNMVKLTKDLIVRKTRKSCSRLKDNQGYVKKLTHAQLQNQYIDEIGDLSSFSSLQVLYLQNNHLTSLDNLETAKNLTHIFLQRNCLSTVTRLYNLYNLRKLYLGYNQISVVEGLEECFALEELHLERQKLPPGVELTFDPRVITALSHRLRLLNVAGCNLSTLSELIGLVALEELNVSDNAIKDLKGLCIVLHTMKNLRILDVRDNEVTRTPKYWDKVVASTSVLCSLDGKDINHATRTFVEKFEANRSQIELTASRTSQSAATACAQDFGKDLPAGLRRSVANKFIRESEGLPMMKTVYLPSGEVPKLPDTPYHFPAFRSSTSLQSAGRSGGTVGLHRRLLSRKATTALGPTQHHSDNALLGNRSVSASVPLQRISRPDGSPETPGAGAGGDVEPAAPDPALLAQLELSLRLVNNVLSLSETAMTLKGEQNTKPRLLTKDE